MTDDAGRRFEAGRRFLARHRQPLGRAGLVEAARRVAALLPEWG
jgi:beta-N-acetylhexosaminidase